MDKVDQQSPAEASPKTPMRPENKIPRDESFKTCKSTMPSPRRRHNLRITPARTSILSGGKPFKEAGATSGRKMRKSRRLAATPGFPRIQNETTDSNETFIRCEQELMFDRDSLDFPKPANGLSSSPHERNRISSTPKPSNRISSTPKPSNRVSSPRKPVLVEKKMPAPKPIQPAKMLPPKPIQSAKMPAPRPVTRRPNPTPKTEQRSLRRPPAFLNTSSRYLSSQWNTSHRLRTQSFKSTAELERDYFSSLRSF